MKQLILQIKNIIKYIKCEHNYIKIDINYTEDELNYCKSMYSHVNNILYETFIFTIKEKYKCNKCDNIKINNIKCKI